MSNSRSNRARSSSTRSRSSSTRSRSAKAKSVSKSRNKSKARKLRKSRSKLAGGATSMFKRKRGKANKSGTGQNEKKTISVGRRRAMKKRSGKPIITAEGQTLPIRTIKNFRNRGVLGTNGSKMALILGASGNSTTNTGTNEKIKITGVSGTSSSSNNNSIAPAKAHAKVAELSLTKVKIPRPSPRPRARARARARAKVRPLTGELMNRKNRMNRMKETSPPRNDNFSKASAAKTFADTLMLPDNTLHRNEFRAPILRTKDGLKKVEAAKAAAAAEAEAEAGESGRLQTVTTVENDTLLGLINKVKVKGKVKGEVIGLRTNKAIKAIGKKARNAKKAEAKARANVYLGEKPTISNKKLLNTYGLNYRFSKLAKTNTNGTINRMGLNKPSAFKYNAKYFDEKSAQLKAKSKLEAEKEAIPTKEQERSQNMRKEIQRNTNEISANRNVNAKIEAEMKEKTDVTENQIELARKYMAMPAYNQDIYYQIPPEW